MKNIQDNSIFKLKKVVAKQLVIPNQDGYKFREVGNPFFIGNDIILIYTMDKDLKEQRLYYSYCNKTNLRKWTHKGRLNINHELEDPFLTIKNGVFSLKAEDRKKPDKFSICEYLSQNWKYKTNTGTWHFSGTKYETAGGAMYSPLSFTVKGKDYTFAEERYTSKYKDISIVDADTRKVLLHYTDDWNILVPDYIYDINNKYTQFGHGLYHEGKPDQRWAHFIATSDNLLSGWEIISEPISLIGIVPIYTDKWNYLCEGSGGLYLGEAKFNNDSKPKTGGSMKPTNLKFKDGILSCNDIPKATRFDAYATGKDGAVAPAPGSFQLDLISSQYSRRLFRVVFTNIASKFILAETQEYWITATIGNLKYTSDRLEVVRGGVDVPEEPIELPVDKNEVHKTNIRSLLSKIDKNISEIYVELDKIK